MLLYVIFLYCQYYIKYYLFYLNILLIFLILDKYNSQIMGVLALKEKIRDAFFDAFLIFLIYFTDLISPAIPWGYCRHLLQSLQERFYAARHSYSEILSSIQAGSQVLLPVPCAIQSCCQYQAV